VLPLANVGVRRRALSVQDLMALTVFISLHLAALVTPPKVWPHGEMLASRPIVLVLLVTGPLLAWSVVQTFRCRETWRLWLMGVASMTLVSVYTASALILLSGDLYKGVLTLGALAGGLLYLKRRGRG
jgi:hypothetical protein